jgi:hypothetical protein
MEGLAGRVVKIILDNSMNSEMSADERLSAPMTLQAIHDKLQANVEDNPSPTHKAVDVNFLKKLLDLMRLDAVGIVNKVTTTSEKRGSSSSEQAHFRVNMEAIIAALQRKTVHSLAVERFGLISGRIVELLQRKRHLEQQAISDMIIAPVKETRERLYRLYKYVCI